MSSEVSSLFAKKKGKKGKKKSTTLNLDPTISKPEEKPKIAQLQEILGGPNPSEDDGWADVVEKKNVVATGGKQVSDLIDMTTLMEDDETTASKLEKQDIKQAFHHARTMKEAKKKDVAPAPVKNEDKAIDAAPTKPKGLSGNIFGGGSAGGPGAGWQARMAERELRQREQELSIDNASAFPTLADAMSGPPKPKWTAGVEQNPWVRRAGGSAAVAAIKAALGRGADEESKAGVTTGAASGTGVAVVTPTATSRAAMATTSSAPKPKPKAADPIWVGSRMGTEKEAEQATRTSATVVDVNGAASVTADSTEKVQEEAPALPPAVAEPVRDLVEVANGEKHAANDSKADKVTETAPKPAIPLPTEMETGLPTTSTDKDALVQQFGKKKKKKKKPVGGDT